MKNPKKHYFLAATRVVFAMPDGTPGVSEHNCVLRWDTRHVNTDGIGKVQQLAQLIFRKKVTSDPNVEIKDVFIVALTYLGLMSEEEFQPTKTESEPAAATAPQAISPLLNPGKSNQAGEIDHVSTIDRGRAN